MFLEIFFFLDMLTGFITAYVDEDNKLIKDMKKISTRYFYQDFIIDLIALIPFDSFVYFHYSRYLYFVKSSRIIKVFKILNVA